MTGADCPFCDPGPRGVIAELGSARVTMDESVHVRGYCCIILRDHATELHEIGATAARALMADIQSVSRVVMQCTGAVKINYEIHGNVIPHVHMHILPRYPGDAIERTGARFGEITESAYGAGEFDALRAAIREGLHAH